MNKQELIAKLNEDLSNEYTHMQFYLHSSIMVQGIIRDEISEWLVDHAKSEFDHIQQFGKMIVGLGGVPTHIPKAFPNLTDPSEIMRYAHTLESEVVLNYAHRMEEIKESRELDLTDSKYVHLFLEDQLLDSRGDLDEIKQFLD